MPAIILCVVIIASLITGFILVRGGLGAPAPAPTEGQVSDLNWSSFTEEGLEYIQRSREIRIDLSDHAEDAVALGLPANGTTVIGPHPEGLEYKFTFNGGGAGLGGDKLIVTQLTITTVDGLISEIAAPIAQVDNFRTTLTGFVKQSELFGWDMSFVGRALRPRQPGDEGWRWLRLHGRPGRSRRGARFGERPVRRHGFLPRHVLRLARPAVADPAFGAPVMR